MQKFLQKISNSVVTGRGNRINTTGGVIHQSSQEISDDEGIDNYSNSNDHHSTQGGEIVKLSKEEQDRIRLLFIYYLQ